MKNIRSLDGLRGVAVLFVVVSHFGFAELGWIGVKIFFVLSGYLITQRLIESRHLPVGHYLGRFYWRRFLRIFPLYYGFLVILTIAYFALPMMKSEWPQFSKEWLSLYSYTFNFARMQPTDVSHFPHVWSLCVEEQFYLVWPLLIFLVPKRRLGHVLVGLLVAIPLFRFGLGESVLASARVIGPSHAARIIYSHPLSHIDGFAIGAVLTTLHLSFIRNPRRLLALVCMVAVGLGFASTRAWVGTESMRAFMMSLGYACETLTNYRHVWSPVIVNTASACAVLCCIRGCKMGLLENRHLVRVGVISYGVYLLHWPIWLIVKKVIPYEPYSLRGIAIFILYLAVTIAVCEASYRLYEVKFLRLKDRFFAKLHPKATEVKQEERVPELIS